MGKRFFYLPENDHEKAIVTLLSPDYSIIGSNEAKFHFCDKDNQDDFNLADVPKTEISVELALSKKVEYPIDIYIYAHLNEHCRNENVCRKNFSSSSVSLIAVKYSYNNKLYLQYFDEQTRLYGLDSLTYGIRSLGYLITVPVDIALSLTPYSLFTGCGGWILGCP